MSFIKGKGFIHDADAISQIAADPEGAREAMDAEESHLAYALLSRWRDTLNATTAPVIGLCGDSVINQSAGYLTTQIQLALGTSGVAFRAAAPASGAAAINDPARWFTWDGARLTASGHVGTAFEGTGNASQTADTLKVYYITAPGGGTFKIQTKKNSGSWTDEAAYLAVSAAGTLAGNVITITKTDHRATWDIRCVWVSGSCDIIGFGAYHSNLLGSRIAQMMNGGGFGNMVDWNTMPAAISNPVFADIGLDLVLLSHLDGAAAVTAQQIAWQEKINRAGAVTISTITSVSNAITFNTATAHGLLAGDSFKVKGTSLPAYNDKWFQVTTVTDSDTVVVSTLANPGSATGGSLSKEPTWVCIGPPMGPDSTIQAANVAQGVAMKALAQTRGDVYWDNNRWAVSPEYALAQNFLLPTDVHYTITARKSWTSRLVTDLGLFNSPDRAPLSEGYYVYKGGFVKRIRTANLGSPTDSGVEIGPTLRIAAADNGSGASLMLENSGGPATANDGWTVQVLADGLAFGPIGSTTWTMRQNVGSGARFWSRSATAAVPDGSIGTPTEPFRSLWMGKTIIATGTTTTPQTIDKVSGSVNFAAGATSVVVNNTHAIAPVSAQTGSIIIATVRTNDTTMKSVAVVCSANGSFTLHANAAPAAETRVDFAIFTP